MVEEEQVIGQAALARSATTVAEVVDAELARLARQSISGLPSGPARLGRRQPASRPAGDPVRF
ncbi:hypothetical protein AB5J52_39700 [Streptomyces sp. R39]|uniref:Uncharacterized protein n=1 Tax=Streptomyces sp. R39 TaxID=3238631 RepID=A0AB39R2P8_9ACTN